MDEARDNKRLEIYLASGSPRRRELLDQIGVCYRVLPISVDEVAYPGEGAPEYVPRIALAKARAGWERLRDKLQDPLQEQLRQQSQEPSQKHAQEPSQKLPELPVIAADTAVVVGDRILGKPANRDEGLAMLGQLSGTSHQVFSAVVIKLGEVEQSRLVTTRVQFRSLSEAECDAYWQTGEPCDKAGGYGIQGFGATFVERIEGSYSAVVGLPLLETAEMLRDFGVSVWNRSPLSNRAG